MAMRLPLDEAVPRLQLAARRGSPAVVSLIWVSCSKSVVLQARPTSSGVNLVAGGGLLCPTVMTSVTPSQ